MKREKLKTLSIETNEQITTAKRRRRRSRNESISGKQIPTIQFQTVAPFKAFLLWTLVLYAVNLVRAQKPHVADMETLLSVKSEFLCGFCFL